MNKFPIETLDNAINVYKTSIEVCKEIDDKEHPTVLEEVTVAFLEELREYRRLEEQGLLLRLLTRDVFDSSGDTVYYIYDYEIVECINGGVSMCCDGKLWIVLGCNERIFPYRNPIPEIDTDPTDWCINSTEVIIDEWGKTVFLAREDAEQRLKEMQEKSHVKTM